MTVLKQSLCMVSMTRWLQPHLVEEGEGETIKHPEEVEEEVFL